MSRATRRTGEQGFVMMSTVLLLLLFATIGAASLTLSGIDLRTGSNYQTGRQAFFSAESGVIHALGRINARGVQDFSADIVDATKWAALFGSGAKAMAGDPEVTYTVTVQTAAADPINEGFITATGASRLQGQRTVRVALRKGPFADPGALYLANDLVVPDFGARDQFLIDGNDHTLAGDLNPAGPLKPGISTRNDTVTQDAIDTLSDPQKMRVQGLGYDDDPLTPSVKTTDGPSVSELDQIISHILANNAVNEVNDPVLPAGEYGTLAAPQVTHLTNQNVRLDGLMTGVGILIAEGEFTINGSANFIGWVIIRGDTVLNTRLADGTDVEGNASILGSLWTGDLVVQVGGSAVIEMCEACMALANTLGGMTNVPRFMTVASWEEVH